MEIILAFSRAPRLTVTELPKADNPEDFKKAFNNHFSFSHHWLPSIPSFSAALTTAFAHISTTDYFTILRHSTIALTRPSTYVGLDGTPSARTNLDDLHIVPMLINANT